MRVRGAGHKEKIKSFATHLNFQGDQSEAGEELGGTGVSKFYGKASHARRSRSSAARARVARRPSHFLIADTTNANREAYAGKMSIELNQNKFMRTKRNFQRSVVAALLAVVSFATASVTTNVYATEITVLAAGAAKEFVARIDAPFTLATGYRT